MAWKELAAGLGTKVLVGEFKAIEHQVSKGEFKRLLSTAVAQLLELHPDYKPRKARRWAQKATGVKPSKKALKASDDLGPKEVVEAGAVTATGAGAAKLSGKVAPRISHAASRGVDRVKAAVEESDSDEHER